MLTSERLARSQQRDKTGACQVIPSGGICLGLAYNYVESNFMTVVSVSQLIPVARGPCEGVLQ